MSQLLVSLLLPALAIAVNPVPIAASVTLLSFRHGKLGASAFLATLALIMIAIGVLTIFILGESSQSSASKGSAAVQVVFGLVFLGIFVSQWRSKPPAEGEQPSWMKIMDKAGWAAGLVLGLALTNYALLSTGTSEIRTSGLSTADQATALAFFAVVSLSTVAATLLVSIVLPHWSKIHLAQLREWLARHNRVILMIVFGLMGALFVALGVAHLIG